MQMPDGSWDRFDDYVIDFALSHLRARARVALVTLFAIDGSSPRPIGAQMAVTDGSDWVGYLSGGCIERAVISEAIDAMAAGENRLVRYGKGSKYLDIQLPCGSAIDLYFDVTVSLAELERLDGHYRARKTASLKIGPVEELAGAAMTRHYHPKPQLIVAGVGAAAVQLLKLARTSGFEARLLSPDAATREACEHEGIAAQSIHSSNDYAGLATDRRSAVVLMFHDHDWERDLLRAVLAMDAFYIGALGGRKTHQMRTARLLVEGYGAHDIARIRGPAGLFHGARSAPAIAASILGEIMDAEHKAFPVLASVTPELKAPAPAKSFRLEQVV